MEIKTLKIPKFLFRFILDIFYMFLFLLLDGSKIGKHIFFGKEKAYSAILERDWHFFFTWIKLHKLRFCRIDSWKYSYSYFYIKVQWALLNGVIDNVFNWLLGSNLSQLTSPKLLFHTWCTFKFIHSLLSVGCCAEIKMTHSDPIMLYLL